MNALFEAAERFHLAHHGTRCDDGHPCYLALALEAARKDDNRAFPHIEPFGSPAALPLDVKPESP